MIKHCCIDSGYHMQGLQRHHTGVSEKMKAARLSDEQKAEVASMLDALSESHDPERLFSEIGNALERLLPLKEVRS